MALFLLLAGVCAAQERDREFARPGGPVLRRGTVQLRPGAGHAGRLPSVRRRAAHRAPAPRSKPRPPHCTSSKRKWPAFDAARTLGGGDGRPRTGAGADSRAAALAGIDPPWEKNPDIYSSGVSNAIFVIMSRNFAPPAERLKIGDRAREAGSAPVPIGAREPEESAAHLYRGRAGTDCRASSASSRTMCRRRSKT